MITRRKFVTFSLITAGAAASFGAVYVTRSVKAYSAKGGKFEIEKTEEEWKAILTPNQFAVLRKHGTEKAGTSPLLNEKRNGVYHCAGCDLALYRSEHKYDSKTGWPSFTQAIPDAIGTQPDNSLFVTRTEAHCRRCGGHLGHIFDDGPKPLGKRHCINGLSLVFQPTA